MATYEQLMDAARRADQDGDEQAARRFLELAAGSQKPKENVIATTPDGGRVIRGADGGLSFASPGYSTSDPDTIKRILEGEGVKEVVQSGFDRQTIEQNPIASRANEFVRGVPFVGSYADEAVGVFSPKAADTMRSSTAAMQREKPVQTATLGIAGGIAGAIPMAIAAAPSIAAAAPASRLGRVVAGVLGGSGTGGTEGAIYGAGEGQTAEERTSSAQTQGAIGAALGGLLGAIGPLAADGIGSVIQKVKKSDTSQIMREFGLSKPAARVVKQHVDAGDIESARRALAQGGDDAMLGEATQGSRSLLDATSAMGGRPEAVVNEAIEGRVTRGNAAFRAASDDAMGAPPQGIRSAADEISQRTGPARNAAYERAFSTPIDYSSQAGRRVEEVVGLVPPKVLRDAIEDANEDMLARELPRNMQILADIADDGSVSFREMPNVQQLDELKKSLQRTAYKNTDQFGRLDGAGQRYNQLAGKLREALDGATGGTYGKAVAIGGDKIAEDEALKLGAGLLRDTTTRDDVLRSMAGASQDARNSAKVGFRNSINEMMDNVRTVASDRNVEAREVKKMVDRLSSKAMRDKARIILGPNEADKFFKEVDRVTSGQNLRAAVSENSRTARRQSVQGSIKDATSPNALQSVAGGEPVASAKQIVQFLTGETEDARAFREEGVAEEIARFLTRTKGRSADAALNYINKAMDGQKLTDAQANYVANLLTTTGFLAGNRAAQQAITPAR